MVIFDSNIADGNVSALILAEAADTEGFDTPQQAVEATIRKFLDENGIGQVMYTRVFEMDPGIDGTVRFSFETAVVPEVKLGKYKGLKINVGFDSDPEQVALAAAAANTEVCIPYLVVERKLDSMIVEKKAEILESSSVNALTDILAILNRMNSEAAAQKGADELWDMAAQAAVRYTESGSMDMPAFIDAVRSVFPADIEEIAGLINDRIYERQTSSPEELAAQVFDSYLRVNGQTVESWREQNTEAAAALCRIDFMLNAVAEKEKFPVSEEEINLAVRSMSAQYQLPAEAVLSIVPKEALDYQIRLEKAKKLIVDSSVQK